MIFRRPFADLIQRQLDLFARDYADLIADTDAAERAYDRADRAEAEERYGDLVDLVETATEQLAEVRDHFASTLDAESAESYCIAYNRAVLKRWHPFAREIENR
ncbi:MAG: hypothetical protein ABR569_12350 [Gaiellaceae bacterium]